MDNNDDDSADPKFKRIGYSAKRTCKLLDIGRTKLFEEIEEGRLNVKYVGRKILVPHDEIMKWIADLPNRRRKVRR